MNFYRENKIYVNKIIFILGLFAFAFIFVKYVFGIVAPFLIAYILSLLLEPLCILIASKFKIGRTFASVITILLFIMLLFSIGYTLMVKIIFEAQSFISSLPKYIQDFSVTSADLRLKYNDLTNIIPEELLDLFQNFSTTLVNSASAFVGSGVKNSSFNFIKLVPSLFVGLIIMLVSCFFFIKDKSLIEKRVARLVPPIISRNFKLVKKGIFSAIGGYIVAQFKLMSITFFICISGLFLIRYQYALFLGLIIAFIDALPILGSGFVLWPWALYSALLGDYSMSVGLLIIYAVIFVTRQVLEPRVLGNQIGIYPLITLMAIYIGLKIYGPLGFMIGPLLVIIIKVILFNDNSDTQQV